MTTAADRAGEARMTGGARRLQNAGSSIDGSGTDAPDGVSLFLPATGLSACASLSKHVICTLRVRAGAHSLWIALQTYKSTCKNINFQSKDNGTIDASCAANGGSFKRASIKDVNDCNGVISNENGRFLCTITTG